MIDAGQNLKDEEKKALLIDHAVYQAQCRNCDWAKIDIITGSGAMAVAKAHAKVRHHDVDVSFSILDQPLETVRGQTEL